MSCQKRLVALPDIADFPEIVRVRTLFPPQIKFRDRPDHNDLVTWRSLVPDAEVHLISELDVRVLESLALRKELVWHWRHRN